MDIAITCNTEDEQLFGNISANVLTHTKWLKMVPAHDGHAVIVGGGPSLADTLRLIGKRHSLGQTIFALNGAARYLNKNGILPDYQIILDARQENVLLIDKAKEHLISSQCHPALLEELPNATLWHPAIEGIAEKLPEYDDSYVLVGGGTTVGLSAMCLAYALGYRKLHIFGFDCSHRDGDGHAYKQPMNDKDILCKVTLRGKTFTSSLTMARQAELFPVVCNNLILLGCIITVDGDGLIQTVLEEMRDPENLPEDEKYRRMWDIPTYRDVAPGELLVKDFVAVAQPKKDQVILDFGCGTGRGGRSISQETGCDVRLIDFAENCLDPDISLPFLVWDITQPMDLRGNIGFCTDVMEHLPHESVTDAIRNIMASVRSCYFQISLKPDNFGELIGKQLHLSVFPSFWWAAKFSGYDIRYSHVTESTATFYVANKEGN